MKILLYSLEYPPFAGGAGLYTSHLADELSALGEEIVVVTPSYSEDHAVWDSQRKYKLVRTGRRFRHRLSFILQCFYLFFNLIKERPRIVHSTDPGSHKVLAVVSLFMPRFYKIFITVHGSEAIWFFDMTEKSLKRAFTRRIAERLFKKASRIICVSNSTRELLLSYYQGSNVVVIYPGINLNNFHIPAPARLSALRKRFKIEERQVLLTVARLVEDKGQDVVIKSLEDVINLYPKLAYIIVGEGPYREQLEALAGELNLSEYVIFAGKADPDELPLFYSLADVFIMPSRRGREESFGVVYVEAYYYRKPVIGTVHGGVPEVIKDGCTGRLVDPIDHTAVAGALIDLLSDPEKSRKMGEEGYKLVLDRFNTGIMAAETRELYHVVLNNRV